MDEDYNMVYGIDKLAELLIERGIEFCVNDELSLTFKDDVGNLHECWMAGADENRVNALIVVTPEQLLSVPDLNGIIAENAKLRELVSEHAHANERLLTELKRYKSIVRARHQDPVPHLVNEVVKLREQIHWLKQGDILHVLTDQEYIDQCERERLMQVSIDALEAENAKLRELVRDMWPFAKSYLEMLPALGINDTESYDIYLAIRKLGVEEDE